MVSFPSLTLSKKNAKISHLGRLRKMAAGKAREFEE